MDSSDLRRLAGKFQISWFQTPLHEFILPVIDPL
jgi:hypothetical protein